MRKADLIAVQCEMRRLLAHVLTCAEDYLSPSQAVDGICREIADNCDVALCDVLRECSAQIEDWWFENVPEASWPSE